MCVKMLKYIMSNTRMEIEKARMTLWHGNAQFPNFFFSLYQMSISSISENLKIRTAEILPRKCRWKSSIINIIRLLVRDEHIHNHMDQEYCKELAHFTSC
uniref:Uncharacterized protein n=1 Tax=Micrurus spixii TaxID=129469 RepID=A0A2D4MV17_9SAUR